MFMGMEKEKTQIKINLAGPTSVCSAGSPATDRFLKFESFFRRLLSLTCQLMPHAPCGYIYTHAFVFMLQDVNGSLVPAHHIPRKMAELERFSRMDVAKHNTSKSCWVIIDDKVYDISKFLEEVAFLLLALIRHLIFGSSLDELLLMVVLDGIWDDLYT